jgi:signal transduction histidine kinase
MEVLASRRLLTPAPVLASTLAHAAAVLESVVGNPHRSIAAITLCGACAAASNVATLYALDRRRLALARALIAASVTVGVGFLWWSDTDGFFALFPTIGMIFVASSLPVAVTSVVVLAATVGSLAWHAGLPLGVIEGHGLGFVGGAAFVLAFVRIALAEQQARMELEKVSGQMEELAVVRERNRIAREIHDGVGHALTAVHVHLETARALADRDGEGATVATHIERAQQGAREALREVRRSVGLLRSSVAPGSLVDAMRALADESRGAGVEVELTIDGAPRRLSPAVEFALYRVAQEALTNVRRHACAGVARVELVFGADSAGVHIRDGGVGTDLEGSSGFGLVGIRERAALLGGSVEVRSSPGRGFELSVRVPT